MNSKPHLKEFKLEADQFVNLRECKGCKVECKTGSLWVTQDDDINDYVLGPGQVLELEHGGDALVFAIMQSDMVVAEPVATPSPLDNFGTSVLEGLESLGNWIGTHLGPEAISSRKVRNWHGAL